MKTKNLILGSAGAFALGCALIAAPVLAESYPSTPAEQAATAELNRQGVMEVHPTPSEQAAYETAQSDYQARLDAFNAEERARQDDFNARQNAYETERQTYEVQKDQFEADARNYQDAVADPFDNDSIDPEDVARLQRLESFLNDGAAIADSPVEDRFGNIVGHFRHMQTDRYGLPTAIITLHNQRTVQVPAEDLRFDPERDTVLADLSYNELEVMRGA